MVVQREVYMPASDLSCIHMEFDNVGIGLAYKIGDHVGVYLENCNETIEEDEKLLGYTLGTFFFNSC